MTKSHVNPSNAVEPIILMSRENSNRTETWEEMLGIKDLGNGKWLISEYRYNMLGWVADLIPEHQRYDEEGNIKVPNEWNGQQIRRLVGDLGNESFETYELVCDPDKGEKQFDASTLFNVALDYCRLNEWDKREGFRKAWQKLIALVTQQQT